MQMNSLQQQVLAQLGAKASEKLNRNKIGASLQTQEPSSLSSNANTFSN
jgi:hypothetical protein